jgi:hypothetical protein
MSDIKLSSFMIGLFIFAIFILGGISIFKNLHADYGDFTGQSGELITSTNQSFEDVFGDTSDILTARNTISGNVSSSGLTSSLQIPVLSNMWNIMKTMWDSRVVAETMIDASAEQLHIDKIYINLIWSILIIMLVVGIVSPFLQRGL